MTVSPNSISSHFTLPLLLPFLSFLGMELFQYSGVNIQIPPQCKKATHEDYLTDHR